MYNLHSSVDDSVLHLTPFLTSGRLTPLTRYRMMGRGQGGITRGSKRRHIRVRWCGQGKNRVLPWDSRMAISMTRIPHDAGNRLSGWTGGLNCRLCGRHKSLSVHAVCLTWILAGHVCDVAVITLCLGTFVQQKYADQPLNTSNTGHWICAQL